MLEDFSSAKQYFTLLRGFVPRVKSSPGEISLFRINVLCKHSEFNSNTLILFTLRENGIDSIETVAAVNS